MECIFLRKKEEFLKRRNCFLVSLMTTGCFCIKYAGTCSSQRDYLILLSIISFSLFAFREQFGVGKVLLPSLWAICFSWNKAQLWLFRVFRCLPGEPTEKPQPFSYVSSGIWKPLWQWASKLMNTPLQMFTPMNSFHSGWDTQEASKQMHGSFPT